MKSILSAAHQSPRIKDLSFFPPKPRGDPYSLRTGLYQPHNLWTKTISKTGFPSCKKLHKYFQLHKRFGHSHSPYTDPHRAHSPSVLKLKGRAISLSRCQGRKWVRADKSFSGLSELKEKCLFCLAQTHFQVEGVSCLSELNIASVIQGSGQWPWLFPILVVHTLGSADHFIKGSLLSSHVETVSKVKLTE